MCATKGARVLCVDDEPNVLEGLRRQLCRHFTVATAGGGVAGLEVIERDGPFAVVVSDMRMPGMDGAAFLNRVRERVPDTVRVLLTGRADLDAAVAAVNKGNIFRFLMKPCPSEVLIATLEASAAQYRLVTAERALLEQVLQGSIKALTCIVEAEIDDLRAHRRVRRGHGRRARAQRGRKRAAAHPLC